jgi:hypothetical protein
MTNQTFSQTAEDAIEDAIAKLTDPEAQTVELTRAEVDWLLTVLEEAGRVGPKPS